MCDGARLSAHSQGGHHKTSGPELPMKVTCAPDRSAPARQLRMTASLGRRRPLGAAMVLWCDAEACMVPTLEPVEPGQEAEN